MIMVKYSLWSGAELVELSGVVMVEYSCDGSEGSCGGRVEKR